MADEALLLMKTGLSSPSEERAAAPSERDPAQQGWEPAST